VVWTATMEFTLHFHWAKLVSTDYPTTLDGKSTVVVVNANTHICSFIRFHDLHHRGRSCYPVLHFLRIGEPGLHYPDRQPVREDLFLFSWW
jgi:hypothetical protein